MKKVIYLQKIGDVDNIVLKKLKQNLKKIFKTYIDSIEISPGSLPLLDSCYNSSRRQYYSRALIEQLTNHLNQFINKESFYWLLGIIDKDLYSKKGDKTYRFVFGGAINNIAILSIFRLRESLYGRPKNKKLFELRVLKEASHEIGHTFDLRHCKNYCVMQFSNSLAEADEKPAKFCSSCSKKLIDLLDKMN